MKTGDINTERRAEDNSERMKKSPVMITILPLLSMLASILPDVINKTTGVNTVKIGIITLLLTGAVAFFISVNAEGILDKKLAKTIIILSYLGSIFLLLFVPDSGIFSFWMICGLIVSMLIDSKLGLLLHFNLSFLMGISITDKPEQVIQVLIIGVLMSMLSGSLRNKSTVIYAAIIILSTNITISFAVNNMLFDSKSNFNYMYSLFSILVVIVIAFFISIIYNLGNMNAALPEDITGQASQDVAISDLSITEVKNGDKIQVEAGTSFLKNASYKDELPDAISEQIRTDRWTSYEVLCDPDNVLLKKLRDHSGSLYDHAIHIGELSLRAAKEIGADEMLTLAGGLYHDIGKLYGKNYIEEGLKIAEEYGFPKELKAIIKEHNIKYEKPGSLEAAIVMLSDSVVSTIEYIEKSDDHKFTTNKIIDNIFQMRLEKGTFDACSLSLKDYKKLKEFYQKEFKNNIEIH